MPLDTANRQIDKGRRMRIWVGEQGPIAGIRAFECTATEAIDRFGEYDSDAQVVDVQVPETNGFIEMMESEKTTFYAALQGVTDASLADSEITAFGSPWVVCNVWNKQRTRYNKGVLVINPVFHTQPFTTALNDATVSRFEFAATRMVKAPSRPIVCDKFLYNAAAGAKLKLTLSRVPRALSHSFLDATGAQGYVLGVAAKIAKSTSAPYAWAWEELKIESSASAGMDIVVSRAVTGDTFAAQGGAPMVLMAYYVQDSNTIDASTNYGEFPGYSYGSGVNCVTSA